MDLKRAVRKLTSIARTEGITGVLRRIRKRIKRSVPDSFDREHGVETAKEVSLFQLDIASENEGDGHGYQASPADAVRNLIYCLPIVSVRDLSALETFTFIDIGAGKGRTLLVASEFPFRRIIGVEFARELVAAAAQNLRNSRAEIIHADASKYAFPCQNLVVYMYHPFGPGVLRRVLASLRIVAHQREVYLIYLNPQEADTCIKEFATELCAKDGAKVYRVAKWNPC